MRKNLFNHVNVDPTRVHIPNGLAKDLEKEGQAYERMIKKAGGIDLQVLGLGRDGHVGFNEPSSSLGSRTRVKTLAPETISDNARFFSRQEEVPRYALTMGVGTIMDARFILLLASGEGKSEALRATIEGPISAECTASVLQLHPKVTIIADEEGASRLRRQEYYKYVEQKAQELGQDMFWFHM